MFEEKQHFINKWILLVFGILLSIIIYRNRFDFPQLFQSPDLWIILSILLLLYCLRLKTNIDQQGIHIRFIPFVWNKLIPWDSVEKAYGRTYTLMDFGGWGYRISSQGIAYNAQGKYGLQLILKNGKRIMIGTQKPKEIEMVLSQLKIN